ncbi:YciI family protein [Amycolatopsis benzoatilytica]|uniref:YciI family protein n=1 Tax=Amycolatopsis benzoatilytica TaxID=346045 RepID=UPI00035E1D82|nr:YciI family protein [Amycolatopsis benzoatilytica]
MAWYLVEIRYVQEKVADVRPRHRDFLKEHAEAGRVAVAGPLADNTGGLMLWQAEDETELGKLIDTDPYALEGVVAQRTVREFKPVLGDWVPAQN